MKTKDVVTGDVDNKKQNKTEKAMYSTNYVRPNGRVSTNKCIGATFKLLCVIVDMYQCLIL